MPLSKIFTFSISRLGLLVLLLMPAMSLVNTATVQADVCGRGKNKVETKFNFGCLGNDSDNDPNKVIPAKFANPIYDLAFSIIRFLTAGVGVVVVAAIIWAGIKYSTSEGNPDATAQAKSNIQSAIVALLIYIFAFAAINYLVPGGLLT